MKLNLIGCLAVLCVACGPVDEQWDTAGAPEHLVTAEAELYQCGFSCSSGSHPSAYRCNSSCPGSCSAVYNETDCQANSGSFFTCSNGCPSGWHPTSYTYQGACRTAPSSTADRNQTYCVPNTGSSFFTCGYGCPSPYRMVSQSFTSACMPSGSNTSNNTSYCVL